MDKRYCVRFIRCDGAIPDVENYYYWNLEDAETHFYIFNENRYSEVNIEDFVINKKKREEFYYTYSFIIKNQEQSNNTLTHFPS